MRITLLGIAGAVLAIVACNATPEIPNDLPSAHPRTPGASTKKSGTADAGTRGSGSGSEADNEGDPPASPDGGSTGPTPSPTPDAGPAPGTCSGETSRQSCYQCCETTNPGALDILDGAFWACMCAGSVCGNECASTACNGIEPAPGSACDQCLGAAYGACDIVATTLCQKSATCSKMLACDDTSGCAGKPGP